MFRRKENPRKSNEKMMALERQRELNNLSDARRALQENEVVKEDAKRYLRNFYKKSEEEQQDIINKGKEEMNEENEISNMKDEDVVVHPPYYYIMKYEELLGKEEIAKLKAKVLTGGRRKTKRKKTKRKSSKKRSRRR